MPLVFLFYICNFGTFYSLLPHVLSRWVLWLSITTSKPWLSLIIRYNECAILVTIIIMRYIVSPFTVILVKKHIWDIFSTPLLKNLITISEFSENQNSSIILLGRNIHLKRIWQKQKVLAWWQQSDYRQTGLKHYSLHNLLLGGIITLKGPNEIPQILDFSYKLCKYYSF